jgi:hypothetical protein
MVATASLGWHMHRKEALGMWLLCLMHRVSVHTYVLTQQG